MSVARTPGHLGSRATNELLFGGAFLKRALPLALMLVLGNGPAQAAKEGANPIVRGAPAGLTGRQFQPDGFSGQEPRAPIILAEDVPVPTPRPRRETEFEGTPEENCASNDPGARIYGCTILIDSGDLEGARLASAYASRGYGYIFKREYNLAILDLNRSLELQPDAAQVHVYRGYAYGLVEDHRNAIADFSRAIELDPGNAGAHADRGSANNAAGNTDDALKDYGRAIELAPDTEFPYSGRAGVYAGLGDDELALADYSQALEITPKHWRNRRERGGLLLQIGHYAAAIEDFSAAIGIWPQDSDSHRDRAIARSMLGKYSGAIRDLDAAVKLTPKYRGLYRTRAVVHEQLQSYDSALADFDMAVSLYDKDIGALVGHARILGLSGDLETGLAQIGKALEMAPDRAEAYLVRAMLQARLGQADRAMEDIHIGFGLEPGSTAIAISAAAVLTQIGDPQGAIAILSPILESDPDNTRALVKRAAAHAGANETPDAMSDSRAAILIRPSVEAFFLRANIQRKAGNAYRAVRELEMLFGLNAEHPGAKALLENIAATATTVLEANPGDTDAKLARSFARLALKPKEQPLLEEIFKDLTETVEAQPDNALAFLAMAGLKKHVGRNDLAAADYQKTVELDPGLAVAHMNLGVIRTGQMAYWLGFIPFAQAARLDPMLRARATDSIRQMLIPATMTSKMQPKNADLALGLGVANTVLGDFDKAFANFEKAIELGPDNPEVYYQRGLAFQATGEAGKAIADFRKAGDLNPGDVRIERALNSQQKDDG